MNHKTIQTQSTLSELQKMGEQASFFRLGSPNPGQEGAPPVVVLSLMNDEDACLSTITMDLTAARTMRERLDYHIARAEQNVS